MEGLQHKRNNYLIPTKLSKSVAKPSIYQNLTCREALGQSSFEPHQFLADKPQALQNISLILRLPRLAKNHKKQRLQGTTTQHPLRQATDTLNLTERPARNPDLKLGAKGKTNPLKYSKVSVNKLQLIEKIARIRDSSNELQQTSGAILAKANSVENFISKKFRNLSRDSRTIVSGIQEYCLEEEATKQYKHQIREMWMKYEK